MQDIIRFYKTGRKKIVFRGVTLEQAQEWCSSPLTRKDGKYFDGYSNTGTYMPDATPIYNQHYFSPTVEYH